MVKTFGAVHTQPPLFPVSTSQEKECALEPF